MGANSTKGYFYLPALGASGQSELDLYNAGQQVADDQLPVFPQAYATGTGTAIDPWAGDCLQDAVNACPAGGTVFCRAGYYEAPAGAVLFYSNKSISVIGEGIQKTFFVTANFHGIYLGDIITDHITLQGFTLDCSAQEDDTSYGITTASCGHSYLTIKDVEVHDAGKYGIDNNRVNYGTFENLYLHGNGTLGLHPGANDTGWNKYNTYRNIYTYDNLSAGISDVGNQSLPNEYLANQYDNIWAWGNATPGIQITNQRGSSISNSYCFDNDGVGFSFYDVEEFNVSNCVSYSNGKYGVGVENSANVNLTNVIVKNNNIAETTYAGISIDDSNNITLTSCQSFDDNGTALQTYGLALTGTNTVIKLIDCKLAPNLTGEISGTTAGIVTSVEGVLDGTKAVVGDIQYHDGTNWVRLAKGTEGQVLTMGASNIPTWATA